MSLRRSNSLRVLIASALMLSVAAPVVAQDEPQPTTVAEVLAGNVTGTVTIDGAALAKDGGDEDEYWFSDGTEVIKIDIDTSSADPQVPLLTLINIVGQAGSEEIDVTSWAPLDIMMAAVIRTPEEAIQAYQGWIVNQNSQAAVEPAATE